MPTHLYHIFLDLVESSARATALRRVLESLSDAAIACHVTISDARTSGSEEYRDAVADEESAVIESIIGAAFVVAQTELNSVIAYVGHLHAFAKARGQVLCSTDGSKPDIRRFGSPVVGQTRYTRIDLINAFANYFKHHDEWPIPWPVKHSTSAMVAAAGAKSGSTGNLRAGLDALGIDRDLLTLLNDDVASWATKIASAYRAELRAKSLL